MQKKIALIIFTAITLVLLQTSVLAENQIVEFTIDSVTETETEEFVSVKIKKIYSSRGEEEKHTAAAIDEDGALWMWGDNSYGKCLADTEHVSAPVKVMENVDEIAIGESHVAVLKTDGSLWAWGKNNEGQLGNGEISISGEPSLIMSDVKKISAGLDFTLALKDNGDLYGFGKNRQYTYSIYSGSFDKPQLLLSGIKDMSAGDEWCFIIDNNDYLKVIGFNGHGQLGNGTFQFQKRYLKIMENVKSVSAGSDCTLIVTKTGDLYGCGKNFYGQLGDELLGTTIPTKIMGNVKDAYCGQYFSLVLDENGELCILGGEDSGFINGKSAELSVLGSSIASVSDTGVPLALDIEGNVHLVNEDYLSDVEIKTPVEKITELKYIFSEGGSITAYVSGKKEFSGGTAVLAFYKEKKLVGTALSDVEKVGDAVTFIPPSESDCCRIFLFENKTTNKPLTDKKELNLSSNINMKATALKTEAEGFDLTHNVTVSLSLNALQFAEKPVTFVMVPDTSQEFDIYDALYIYQGTMESDGTMEITFPIHRDFSNTKIRASAGGVALGECYVFESVPESAE